MRRMGFSMVFALCAASAQAESHPPQWPQWRGPDLNGVSRATGLPLRWSQTENIVWKAALPAWGGSSPIVCDGCVFVTSPSAKPVDNDAEPKVNRRLPARWGGRSSPGGPDLLLFCFEADDGSLRWKKKLGSGNQLFGKQNMASPSPVTDGKFVVAMTGTGAVTAFDFAGKQIWRRDLAKDYGQPAPAWGYASSPVLFEGRVIIPVMHGSRTSTPSYVVALDIENGKTLWKIERRTDAQRECPDAYTTPVLSKHDGRTDLVILGANYVTAHDPATGREIWRAGGMNPKNAGNYRIVASPIAVDGMVFTPTRKRPFLAFKAGGVGDVSESHRLWSYEKSGAPDVPTPACDGKYLYLVDDKGIVVCLNARSGEVVWGPQRTAVGTVSASPVLADGKLYITNENATTTVLKAGPKFEVMATNKLDDAYTISSMALIDSRIFLRTSTHLLCIGE